MPRIQSVSTQPENDDQPVTMEAPVSVSPPGQGVDNGQFLRYTDEGGDYTPHMHPSSMVGTMEMDQEASFQSGSMDPPLMQADSQVRTGSLAAPNPRNGMDQRWVRASARGDNDTRNWLSAMNAKWRPRDPATIPESEHYYPVVDDGSRSVIRVGDLVLCERPEVISDQKRQENRQRADQFAGKGAVESEQLGAQSRNEGTTRGLEREDKVTSTRGRRPATMVG